MFQSTRPRGTRLKIFMLGNTINKFQSTRPRGTRRQYGRRQSCSSGFNPRVREGRDGLFRAVRMQAFVSIHASARDATQSLLDSYRIRLGFQSTRPRGTRPINLVLTGAFSKFQSTRPRGTRLREDPALSGVQLFQSTRPRGTRQHHRSHQP